MKFSIIVPVYNVEKYLPRCLDSVLDQEFDDYEIIAVDDESPDNSIDILNEYQKKTEKLKIQRVKIGIDQGCEGSLIAEYVKI